MRTTCAYCRAALEPEDPVTLCPACGTPHHEECFAENAGCTIFGCPQAPVDEPKLSVSSVELAPQNARNGINGLNGSAPAPARQPSPPPPPPRVAPPPREHPLPVPFAGFSAYSNIHLPPAAYVPPPRRRTRVVYVLLAVFLGAFGGHNFYAGYTKRAVIQLSCTVLSLFIGGFIIWVWGLVEACVVDRDRDGNAFI